MPEGSSAPDANRVSPAPARPAVLVSACLVGVRCNHVGRASTSEAVRRRARANDQVPICPEVAGGLPIPRAAAELQPDGGVRTADGTDVTDAYERGAEVAVRVARGVGAERAVLKARSPSCGCHQLYDGTFSRVLVDGEGVTARVLRRAGIEVCSEEDIPSAS